MSLSMFISIYDSVHDCLCPSPLLMSIYVSFLVDIKLHSFICLCQVMALVHVHLCPFLVQVHFLSLSLLMSMHILVFVHVHLCRCPCLCMSLFLALVKLCSMLSYVPVLAHLCPFPCPCSFMHQPIAIYVLMSLSLLTGQIFWIMSVML